MLRSFPSCQDDEPGKDQGVLPGCLLRKDTETRHKSEPRQRLPHPGDACSAYLRAVTRQRASRKVQNKVRVPDFVPLCVGLVLPIYFFICISVEYHSSSHTKVVQHHSSDHVEELRHLQGHLPRGPVLRRFIPVCIRHRYRRRYLDFPQFPTGLPICRESASHGWLELDKSSPGRW